MCFINHDGDKDKDDVKEIDSGICHIESDIAWIGGSQFTVFSVVEWLVTIVGCVCWGGRCLLFAPQLPFPGWELPLHAQLNTHQRLCNSPPTQQTLAMCKYLHNKHCTQQLCTILSCSNDSTVHIMHSANPPWVTQHKLLVSWALLRAYSRYSTFQSTAHNRFCQALNTKLTTLHLLSRCQMWSFTVLHKK